MEVAARRGPRGTAEAVVSAVSVGVAEAIADAVREAVLGLAPPVLVPNRTRECMRASLHAPGRSCGGPSRTSRRGSAAHGPQRPVAAAPQGSHPVRGAPARIWAVRLPCRPLPRPRAERTRCAPCSFRARGRSSARRARRGSGWRARGMRAAGRRCCTGAVLRWHGTGAAWHGTGLHGMAPGRRCCYRSFDLRAKAVPAACDAASSELCGVSGAVRHVGAQLDWPTEELCSQ
jgi:hypothetical protein